MATIYYTAASTDGFIAGPGDDLSWLDGHERDPESPHAYERFIERVGALCMGRGTYDWVTRQHPETVRDGLYEQPTWVVTTRGLEPAPPRTRAFGGDVRELHGLLTEAAGGKDVWVVGGGGLAGQFADAGLLDEVWVQTAPVTLGAGTALLPRPLRLELVEAQRNGAFVDSRYRVLR